MNIPQTRYIYKREAHPWMMHKVKSNNGIQSALLFCSGLAPKYPRQNWRRFCNATSAR
ncbi:Uncharacterised protein [Klebsiella pneumoniae]|nr:Uncharacterised protein [Klebsiella pneumoniae]